MSLRKGHRQFICLAGEKSWQQNAVDNLLGRFDYVVVDASSHVNGLLGAENASLVYDANDVFDPNLLAAAAGTVRGRGIFVLLVPDLTTWSKKAVGLHGRILVEGHSIEDIQGRYLSRFINILKKSYAVILYQQSSGDDADAIKTTDAFSNKEYSQGDFVLTQGQEQALLATEHVVGGHRHRPLVITADRGRGKSTVLGLAAAKAISKGKKVVVCAMKKSAAWAVFYHAEKQLKQTMPNLLFFPPDELIHRKPAADLLLVDEAAAIPLPMLEEMLDTYPRIVFASTLHGYEGSGRGFKIRFSEMLNNKASNWKKISLTQPVRWDEDDPLENFLYKSLMLDAEIKPINEEMHDKPVELRIVDRDGLLNDEPLLRQTFALLVEAHYQTTPMDLLNILDGPNIALFALIKDSQLVAIAWVAKEGDLDADLMSEIRMGRRRPRGHLLPQSLIAQSGFNIPGEFSFSRIVRIAVHPDLQRNGLGTAFAQQLVEHAQREKSDYIGVSFAASAGLINFWQAISFSPLRVGMSRDAASGAHSILMLRPLSRRAKKLHALLQARFYQQLRVNLIEPLKALEPDVLFPLLKNNPEVPNLSLADQSDLKSFSEGSRQYADCLLVLCKATLILLAQYPLSEMQARLLICKVLQHRSWEEVKKLTALSGKKELTKRLREIFSKLLVA